MKQFYAVLSGEKLKTYQAITQKLYPKLKAFINYLQTEYRVNDLPRCILWTELKTATKLLSDIPIPAYTNEYRTVFCPERKVWQQIYLQQLSEYDVSVARSYYETALTDNHILQILGHEFVHHSDLFIDEAYEQSRWFEEGMCEYISRKFFLTAEEFAEAAQIQKELIRQYEEHNGVLPIEEFDASTYGNSIAAIFYQYWRSFQMVNQLIEENLGDVLAVFRKYREWAHCGCPGTLRNWFLEKT